MGRGVERPWWTINWVAWQRDHPKRTFGQRHRRALVHLEELESAESAERTLSGYDENVEALPYRCMWLWGETDYVSSYDMWWCPQLHVDRPGFSNPCRCQLCQTLGGINLTVDIEDSTKNDYEPVKPHHSSMFRPRNQPTIAQWLDYALAICTMATLLRYHKLYGMVV